MSPYKEIDPRSGEIHAFHLEGDEAQADARYWVPTDRRRRYFLPRRFGAFVHRADAPNVALVIEPQPDKRRFAITQIAFENEDEFESIAIRSSDLRACPLDRWGRLAAKAMLHTAEHDHPKTDRTTLRDRHDEAHARRISFHSLSDTMAKVVARPAPGKPRTIDRRDLERVAELYRAEMERAAESKGHARPAEYVAESLHISRATAGRWIKRARAEGLLGPANRTRAGEAPVLDDT
jgi:hypothetical protein